MNNLNMLQQISVLALPVLLAITVHEFAHGWVAMKLGDQTAKMLGRVTLNPLKHIDPLGTVIIPIAMYAYSGFLFGWAKPVPVGWKNLKNPNRDMALVAFAGPASNLVMAFIWGVILSIGVKLTPSVSWLGVPMVYMGKIGIWINAILFVLNLLPIPPLDGGRILTAVLPNRWSNMLDKIEPFGLFILVALMVSGVLWNILGPPIQFIYDGLLHLLVA